MSSIIIREGTEYANNSDSLDKIQKEKDYISYLETHISNVKKAYINLFLPLVSKELVFNDAPFSPQEFKDAIILAKSAVRMHDMSKWGEAEFEPYRAHWNPTDEEKLRGEEYQTEVEIAYQNAWEHHYQNNDHHPKFWYDFENNVARDMSLDAIIHMLCDWESFDIDSPSRTVKWYINHSIEEHKFMSPQTIAKVEYILYNILFPEEYKKIAKTSDNLAIYRDNK